MNRMKKTATAFALIGIFSVMLYGQAKNRVPRPPAEWSLTLKDQGAPWENRVEVQLNQDGTLVVLEQNPPKKATR